MSAPGRTIRGGESLRLQPRRADLCGSLGAAPRYRLAQLEAQLGRTADARATLADGPRAAPALRRQAAADPKLKEVLP